MYDNKVNTNFQGKETPKGDSSYKCLSLIMLDSVEKVRKKYYPQVLLKECKYVKRKNKMFNYINDDLEMTSSNDDDELLMNLIVNLIVILIVTPIINDFY